MTPWHFVVVADAIAIGVRFAVTATHAEGVELVAVAVAIAFWNIRTSTFVDGARAIADAALVVGTHAVVYVVTDAIGILVGRAIAATDAEGVQGVAIAIASAFRNEGACPVVVLGVLVVVARIDIGATAARFIFAQIKVIDAR